MRDRTEHGRRQAAKTPWPDTWLVLGGEQILGRGEDAYTYSIGEDSAMICVLDGLGGSGSRKYEKLGDLSGAYIGSHAAADAVREWYAGSRREENAFTEQRLKERIMGALRSCEARVGTEEVRTSLIKGSMLRKFPTTVSVAVCAPEQQGGTAVDYFWAGDSRGYLLTPDGLVQITADDVGEEELRGRMNSDGVMTNLASLSVDWHLNRRKIVCSGPAIVITATDGCFGYLRTPMEFEYHLIQTMMASESVSQWQEKLDGALRERAGDDFTFLAVVFGFGSLEEMKRRFTGRVNYLADRYIVPMENASQQELEAMWIKYSGGYYGHN